MNSLANKSAIVTGASRGIGRAIALTLATQGAKVVVNYSTHQQRAEELVTQVRQQGGEAIAFHADVREFSQVQAMVKAAIEAFGQIDILVNNAGIIRDNFLALMRDQEWDDVLDTNLKGAFYCIKAVSREMMRRKTGRIINISSAAGLMGDLRRANYAAAKAGLIGLTKTAARELAASGICVNAVAPGIINTEMIANLQDAARSKQTASIPVGRFGEADEVAGLVAFLASDAAGYITGQVIGIDGGLNM